MTGLVLGFVLNPLAKGAANMGDRPSVQEGSGGDEILRWKIECHDPTVSGLKFQMMSISKPLALR